MRQAEGFDNKAQEALRAALPLRRTIDLSDGDCVLISTAASMALSHCRRRMGAAVAAVVCRIASRASAGSRIGRASR